MARASRVTSVFQPQPVPFIDMAQVSLGAWEHFLRWRILVRVGSAPDLRDGVSYASSVFSNRNSVSGLIFSLSHELPCRMKVVINRSMSRDTELS